MSKLVETQIGRILGGKSLSKSDLFSKAVQTLSDSVIYNVLATVFVIVLQAMEEPLIALHPSCLHAAGHADCS